MKHVVNICLLVVIANVAMGQTLFPEITQVYTSYDEFEQELLFDDNEVHVINFWATWCGPCVKELPYFEQLHQKYQGKGLDVKLVSIDFADKIEKKLIPFLKKNNYNAEVIVFDDPKTNEWIDRVDPSWSGAIPITIFIKGNKRIFKEQSFHSLEELEEIIHSL